MYASFGILQVLDYQTTERAFQSSTVHEVNPIARALVANRPALIVAKAAGTVAVVVAGEKMWKRNRVGAVVFVASVNCAMAVVVAHNYSVEVRRR